MKFHITSEGVDSFAMINVLYACLIHLADTLRLRYDRQ